jgi:serine/threonine-protein kinase
VSDIDYAKVRAAFDLCAGLDGEVLGRALAGLDLSAPERAELDALLAAHATPPAHDEVQHRIQSAAAATLPGGDRRQRLGPWRITGELGEGGMGVVLSAVRDDGEFTQRAAIKVIRGFPSDTARERLRRERQILAGLEHPNIARVLDGGSTRSGEPYLVMEYVDGELLPAWLARQPPLRARVRLFASICRAVAFAHQRLVVHRDLKPGNVMVRPDGVPVLLDFGIAKLLDDSVAPGEGTRTHAMTPAWASPEQLRGEAVTTASDVFALGLLLYVLLGGDINRRASGSSTRTHEVESASLAARGSTDATARAFAPELRGDLDAIVRLATRHDAGQRYASVSLLQQDIEAWLDGRPVSARAGDRWYLTRMFIQRQRVPLGLGAVLLMAVAAFVVQLAAERDRARAAQARAVAEATTAREVLAFVTGLFGELDPYEGGSVNLSGRELLDRGRAKLDTLRTSTPRARAALEATLGEIYRNSDQPDAALALLESAHAYFVEHAESPKELIDLETQIAQAHNEKLQTSEALPYIEAALRRAEPLERSDPGTLAHVLMTHGVTQRRLGRHDVALRDFLRAQQLFGGLGIEGRKGLASVLHNLGWVAESQGDHEAALEWYRKSLEAKRELLGGDHPQTINTRMQIAAVLAGLGRLAEAEALLLELLPDIERRMGARSGQVATIWNELGSVRQDQGHYAEAAEAYRRSIDIVLTASGGIPDGSAAQTINNLASLDEERGDLAAAERGYRASLEARLRVMPADSLPVARARFNLARVLLRRGRAAEAEPLAAAARAVRDAKLPDGNTERLGSAALAVDLLLARGDTEAARDAAAALAASLAAARGVPGRAVAAAQRALARAASDASVRIAALRAARDALAGALPEGHPVIARAELDLADALATEAPAEAAALRARATPILDAALSPASPDRARLRAATR